MHWYIREKVIDTLRQEITNCQQELSELLKRNLLNKAGDPMEVFKARSILQARLNNAQKDFEIWLDSPRILI